LLRLPHPDVTGKAGDQWLIPVCGVCYRLIADAGSLRWLNTSTTLERAALAQLQLLAAWVAHDQQLPPEPAR
jgi:hypothetical protein